MKNPTSTNMLKLAAKGIRSGQNINTALRDLVTGRFLFRHSSSADEWARQLDKHTEQDQAVRTQELEAMDRLNRALDRVERHLEEKDKGR